MGHGVRVLTETPPAPDVQGLRDLWSQVGDSGLVQVMDFMASQPIANGALVEVLRPVRALGPAIRASYLPRRRWSPKVRAFVQILEALLLGPPATLGAVG